MTWYIQHRACAAFPQDAPLGALGLDSMEAMQLMALLEERFMVSWLYYSHRHKRLTAPLLYCTYEGYGRRIVEKDTAAAAAGHVCVCFVCLLFFLVVVVSGVVGEGERDAYHAPTNSRRAAWECL